MIFLTIPEGTAAGELKAALMMKFIFGKIVKSKHETVALLRLASMYCKIVKVYNGTKILFT